MKKLFLVSPAFLAGVLLCFIWHEKPAVNRKDTSGETPPLSQASSDSADFPAQGQPRPDHAVFEKGNSNAAEVKPDWFENPELVLSEVVVNGRVNQRASDEFLAGPEFSALTAALRTQPLTAEESMRNESFKRLVGEHASSAGYGVTYEEMECGISVCAVSVQIHDGDGWKRFYNDISDNEAQRTYVTMGKETSYGGINRLRVLFSIDPEVRGIVVPAPR